MKSVTIGNRVYKQSTKAHLRTGISLRDTDSTYTLNGGIMEQVKKEETHTTYEPIDIFNKGE